MDEREKLIKTLEEANQARFDFYAPQFDSKKAYSDAYDLYLEKKKACAMACEAYITAYRHLDEHDKETKETP